MASFTEVAEELARQKIRLEKLKESPDVRSELANSVYPLLAMCNEAMSETIIALSQAIEQRVSQLEQAITDIGDLLDAEDDDDDDDGLDDEFILDLVTKTESLMEKLEGEPRELAEQIRNQLKQLTDDNDGADDGAEEETQEAGNADGSKED